MWRIRLLRIVVPVLVAAFLVFVVREVRRRPAAAPPAGTSASGTIAEGISFRDLEGALEMFKLTARRVTEPEAGRQQFEGVERLEIARRGAPPLIVRADRGTIRGSTPNRTVEVEGGIEVRDENAGIVLQIPALDVVESERLARSRGEVTLAAPAYSGRAGEVLYPLDGGPTVLHDVVLEDQRARRLTAGTLRKAPESEVIEGDDLRVEQGADWASAPRGTLEGSDGVGVRSLLLEGGVAGSWRDPKSIRPAATASAAALRLDWDDAGELRRAALTGRAEIRRGPESIEAERLEATRMTGLPERWEFSAEGRTVLRGMASAAEHSVTCDRIEGWTSRDGTRAEGRASGSVRFEGPGRLALADQADVRRENGLSTIVLQALGEAKARMVETDRSVAAERITVVDPTGFLQAEGQVETTLLPATDGDDAERVALFEGGEAVHFVSRAFEARNGGEELVFLGGARGWQGERSLAAATIQAFRERRELRAVGGVTTRIPLQRETDGDAQEFLEITAADMKYEDVSRTATYTGSVRVRQTDGILESDRLEVLLEENEGRVRLVRAEGDVRIDYRYAPANREPARIAGRSDRAEYLPQERVMRLFGDQRPASVERSGRGGIATRGKVLLYRLESGAVEVEGGDANRATIQTSAP